MQLNKYLACSGITSRRKAADLIKQGLVQVNNIIVIEPHYMVKEEDSVSYKNSILHIEKKLYIVLNKPKGYITTLSDEKNRKTVMDLVHIPKERIYPIGRLDRDTTGILLLTNDGDLAQKLSHPKHSIQKTYFVTLNNLFSVENLKEIEAGITLEDGAILVDQVVYGLKKSEIYITLHSGKNRIVRRIFEHFGYIVVTLDRILYANIGKNNLKVGTWRFLLPAEVENLKKLN